MASKNGSIEAIFICLEAASSMSSVRAIRAVEGKGLEGDRYFRQAGTWSRPHHPGSHITLVEAESVEAVKRDYKIDLRSDQTRRNLVTRGVALNHLVGKRFSVGGVALEGTKLCDPCNHLEKLTTAGVKTALTNRGGLCANVLTSGVISEGDPVVID